MLTLAASFPGAGFFPFPLDACFKTRHNKSVSKRGERSREMALTRDEITAGAAYTVRFQYGELSPKRFRDAVKLVKALGQRPETTARYDGTSKTWHVELPDGSVHGLADLQTLAYIYNADVERA